MVVSYRLLTAISSMLLRREPYRALRTGRVEDAARKAQFLTRMQQRIAQRGNTVDPRPMPRGTT